MLTIELSMIATWVALPPSARAAPGSWNATTHGNLTFVVILLVGRFVNTVRHCALSRHSLMYADWLGSRASAARDTTTAFVVQSKRQIDSNHSSSYTNRTPRRHTQSERHTSLEPVHLLVAEAADVARSGAAGAAELRLRLGLAPAELLVHLAHLHLVRLLSRL
jgi:hypothetical protein